MKFSSIASLLALLTLHPDLAAAQDPPTKSKEAIEAENKALARDLSLQGYAALDRKDYKAAADLFLRANTLYHAPTILLGLARANIGLGRLLTAQEYYNQISHEQIPANAPPAFQQAVEEAQRELPGLMKRVPGMVINVKWTGEFKVMLDGVEIPNATLGVRRAVDPGPHVVKAYADGAADGGASVNLGEGVTEAVTIELHQGKGSSPPPSVVVDPLKGTSSTPAGRDNSTSSTQKTVGLISMGVGGVGLIVGGVAGGLAMSKNSELSAKCPGGVCPHLQKDTIQPIMDSYQSMGAVSTAGFIAGGALAATGVVLWLTGPAGTGNKTAVLPLVGPGFVGVQGRF